MGMARRPGVQFSAEEERKIASGFGMRVRTMQASKPGGYGAGEEGFCIGPSNMGADRLQIMFDTGHVANPLQSKLELIFSVGQSVVVICDSSDNGKYYRSGDTGIFLGASNMELGRACIMFDRTKKVENPKCRNLRPAEDMPVEEPSESSGGRRVFFLRHGQAEHNLKGSSEDTLDPLLTHVGRAQASSWAAEISKLGAEVVLVSPLRRAVETACLAFERETTPLQLCNPARERWWDKRVNQVVSPEQLHDFLVSLPRGSEISEVDAAVVMGLAEPKDEEASIGQLLELLRARLEVSIMVVCHWGIVQSLCKVNARHCDVVECVLTDSGDLRAVAQHPSPHTSAVQGTRIRILKDNAESSSFKKDDEGFCLAPSADIAEATSVLLDSGKVVDISKDCYQIVFKVGCRVKTTCDSSDNGKYYKLGDAGVFLGASPDGPGRAQVVFDHTGNVENPSCTKLQHENPEAESTQSAEADDDLDDVAEGDSTTGLQDTDGDSRLRAPAHNGAMDSGQNLQTEQPDTCTEKVQEVDAFAEVDVAVEDPPASSSENDLASNRATETAESPSAAEDSPPCAGEAVVEANDIVTARREDDVSKGTAVPDPVEADCQDTLGDELRRLGLNGEASSKALDTAGDNTTQLTESARHGNLQTAEQVVETINDDSSAAQPASAEQGSGTESHHGEDTGESTNELAQSRESKGPAPLFNQWGTPWGSAKSMNVSPWKASPVDTERPADASHTDTEKPAEEPLAEETPAAAEVPRVKEPSYTALMFPGNGSQYVSMLSELKDDPVVKGYGDAAHKILGYDLLDLCISGPEDTLFETTRSQPAMFLAGVAGMERLKEARPDAADNPGCVAGLSLGEYTALCVAGVFTFEQGLALVKLRSEAMAEAARACPQSMMTVAGLDREALEALCEEHTSGADVAVIANVLFPKGYACSGTLSAIEKLQAACMKAGAAQAKILKTSGAFHSKLMQSASEKLHEALIALLPELHAPRCDVYMNCTGSSVKAGTPPSELVPLLCKQLTSPALWEPSVRLMIKDGMSEFFEIGPMKQLKAMMKRIDLKAWQKTASIGV